MEILKPKGLICPKCKIELAEHEEGACPKRLSRRFFLGALGSAFAGAAALKAEKLFEIKKPSGPLISAFSDNLVVIAAPKIEPGTAILADYNGAERYDVREWQGVAIRTGRPVIVMIERQVKAMYDRTGKETFYIPEQCLHS